jgi:aryl-alcohol dehydrogenase-like predicted oxidoreductase
MQYRPLGRTGFEVSAISFGAWAIGGTWGPVDDQNSLAALNKAVDLGVNFIDTADVYGDGRSERLIGQLRKDRARDTIIVATKAGRRLPEQRPEGYTRENLNAWIDRSRRNLQMETLDLVQLHCPHTKVYDMPEVFGILDEMTKAGKIRYYGISVETVDEALRGIRHPNVQTVQIIFNMFRLKPAEQFFEAAKARQVGILARVPLASGLLTGKMTRNTQFAADDHRSFNREGQAFDKGETFSGVPYDAALDAVEELRKVCPAGVPLAQFALRWILMFDAVSCAIPGAKTPEQAAGNVAAADLPALSPQVMAEVQRIYDTRLRAIIHPQW